MFLKLQDFWAPWAVVKGVCKNKLTKIWLYLLGADGELESV